MSVKKKRKSKPQTRKSAHTAPQLPEGETTFTLNAILADFRADKDAGREAGVFLPEKDVDMDSLFEVPAELADAAKAFTESVDNIAGTTGLEDAAEAFTQSVDNIAGTDAEHTEAVAEITDTVDRYTQSVREETPVAEIADSADRFTQSVREETPVAEIADSVDGFTQSVREETPAAEIADSVDRFTQSIREETPAAEIADNTDKFTQSIREETPAAEIADSADGSTQSVREETPVAEIADSVDGSTQSVSGETPAAEIADSADSFTQSVSGETPVAEIADSADGFTQSVSDILQTEETLVADSVAEAAERFEESVDNVAAAEEIPARAVADSAAETGSTGELPETDDMSATQLFERVETSETKKEEVSRTRRRLFHRRKPEAKQTPDEPPRSISLEEVVGNTVDAVRADAAPSRHSLFSRRRMDDTDEEVTYDAAHQEVVGPEPDLRTASEQARRDYVRRIDGVIPAIVPAVLPVLTLLLEAVGVHIPFLTGNVTVRSVLLFCCLGGSLWFCRSVFTDNRCTGAFLCGISAVAAALDCLTVPFFTARSIAEPYGAVACLGLIAAKIGSSLENHGTYDTFHTAGLDRHPPYLVTDTARGVCKKPGTTTGFYTSTLMQNFSIRSQTVILPLTLAASVIFAVLSSVRQGRYFDFFLNWSAILATGATLVLPLCWGVPWARMASRLKKAGCAVAGWHGAEQIARKKKMIVTDNDLFPPGSVVMQDVRAYDEEMSTIASIAASMVRESGCGLERIFDDLLQSELGDYLPVKDFQFYEDGGFSGTIGEESVLLGTSSFLRKMSVCFPGDFYFPMGLYLAINGELAATFALKYRAAENVDFALRLIRRGRITVILAARDPNLNPKLLQRVFGRKIDVEYPGLNNRIVLSAVRMEHDLPRGLLFREGLLPYAESVSGSLRLYNGVRRATFLALCGNVIGELLAFYLVFQAKYYLLSPLNLLLFLLLWTLPTVLLMDLS